jgi:hypothetical protein
MRGEGSGVSEGSGGRGLEEHSGMGAFFFDYLAV